MIDKSGADEPPHGVDQSTWANYVRGPSIHNGLTAAETTENHFVHGDAER